MLRFPALVAFCCLVVCLSGCAGGSSAPSGGNTGTTPAPPAADFTLSVTPATLALTAGNLGSAVTISITGNNGFTGAVNVTASMPVGFSCGGAACSGQAYTGKSLTLQVDAAREVAAGDYNVTFTGTTSTLSHQASLSATVAAAPVISTNNSADVFTDDFISPYWSVAYDKAHDHIFASNRQLSEVEVISPETLQVIRTIYVPSPTGMDLSPDGSTLYVGSNTQNLFEISTAALDVQARVPFAGNPQFDFLFPTQVVALADGTLGILSTCGTINPCTTGSGFFILNPATGAAISPLSSVDPGALYASPLTPSADRTKLFMTPPAGFPGGGNFLEYSTVTGSLSSLNLPGNGILIARPDGKGYAIAVDTSGNAAGSGQLLFLDPNLQQIGSWTNSTNNGFTGHPIYSADSSRLYIPDGITNSWVNVFDANAYQYLGKIPTQGATSFFAVDGENRLLSPNSSVLTLVDGNATPGSIATAGETLGFANSLLAPDHPANGYATTLNGSAFSSAPQVAFNGTFATNVQIDSSNAISLTAPQLQSVAQANLTAVFPDGTTLVAPDAYSYQPTILYTDMDGSAENGGTTLNIYGFGLDFSADQLGVMIGDKAASNLTPNWIGISPYFAPVYALSATVPPGTEGNADIEVSTPIGNVTVPGGFTYVRRTDFALPSTAEPFQMILDKSRNRLLWTDTATNAVVVYSLSSGQIQQTISVGNTPAGLSITPDDSDLLVADFGDNKINVYDAQSLALIQQATVPTPAMSISPAPVWVAAVANGKAFVTDTENGSSNLPVFEYDIATNSFTQRSDARADEGSYAAASADGSTVFAGFNIWNAATDAFVPAFLSQDYPRALSSDGYVIAEYRMIWGKSGMINGIAGVRWSLQSDMDFNSVGGQKLNATGSLSYLPEVDRIRIFDVRHGQLIRTIMVPDKLNSKAVDGMAIDPDGQTIYVLTQTGVTTLQFAADPLSIGEVQATGNQLTILGSGFSPEATVTVDGSPAVVSFQNSQELIASVSSLSPGAHQIVIALPSGPTYSLDNALDAGTSGSGTAARIEPASAHTVAPAVLGPTPKQSLWQRLHPR